MDQNLSDFSTVIIVNKGHGQTRSMQVKTKHLLRFKHYAVGVFAVIVCLFAAVFYLNDQTKRQEEEKQSLLSQIVQLKHRLPSAAPKVSTGNTAQTYIQSIQDKLQTINNYLKKRGIKGFTTAGTGSGGKALEPALSDIEKYSMYNDYLSRLLLGVAFTPMGYPRTSGFTSGFGYRSDPFNDADAEYHPGIDFKGSIGDRVKCTASGKVVFAGWFGGYGNCVRIQHANNLETLYGHLSKIDVKPGQNVSVGDVIGAVGSTGHSTGAHLHYEVRKNGKPINPVNYLNLNS